MLSKRACGIILESRRWRVSRATVWSSSISISSIHGGTQLPVELFSAHIERNFMSCGMMEENVFFYSWEWSVG
jgi:hypothetical protein